MRPSTGPRVLLLALLGCVPPETGINHAVIHGTVRVSGERRAEKASNDLALAAQRIGPLDEHVVAVDGTIDRFGVDAFDVVTGDVDWFQVSSSVALEPSRWVLSVTAEAEQTFRFVFRAPDEGGEPVVVLTEDVAVGAGETLAYVFQQPIAPGVEYQLAVGGVAGTGTATWEFIPLGPDPNDTPVLVGAYATRDLRARLPRGGAEVGTFVLGPDLTWEAPYTIRNLRAVGADRGQGTRVDESVGRVWLFAGSWPTLNGGLPAGTWYSSEPVGIRAVACPNPDERTAAPLYLDARSPLVIGETFLEVEPNEVTIDADAFDWDVGDGSTAQDLGVLSGVGIVDLVRGTSAFATGDPGWIHDVDAYKFRVPEDTLLLFTMDWDDPSVDLDLVVTDFANDLIDIGATAANPEVNYYADTPITPEVDYYLLVLGYLGPPGQEVPYEVQLEQTAP